jgi:hypothetical protein
MTDVRIEHVYNCSEDTFWNQIFFDEEYNRRLFAERLKFPVWKEIRREDRGNELFRVVEVVPRLGEMPAPLKKVVGDNVRYEEHGTYDKQSRRYRIKVIPNKLADKVSVEGDLYTEPVGDGKCKRIFAGKVVAKIFGVGGLLEKRLAGDLEKSYEIGARFTNDYISEKGL